LVLSLAGSPVAAPLSKVKLYCSRRMPGHRPGSGYNPASALRAAALSVVWLRPALRAL